MASMIDETADYSHNMSHEMRRFEIHRDALLDEIERLNIMIYEHHLALERLKKSVLCTDDDDMTEVMEY